MSNTTNDYKNIRAEISREKLSIQEIARRLGIAPKTLSLKLARKNDFTLLEAIKMQSTCFPDRTLEYLFQEDFSAE